MANGRFSKIRIPFLIGLQLSLAFSCGGVDVPVIERVQDHEVLSAYRLTTFNGRRDGDRLDVVVVFTSAGGTLEMNLRFQVGVPTRLAAGRYRWHQPGDTLEGRVSDRSITFLGGQSDRPSLGGVFDLLSPGDEPLYRVEIPTAELNPLDP